MIRIIKLLYSTELWDLQSKNLPTGWTMAFFWFMEIVMELL